MVKICLIGSSGKMGRMIAGVVSDRFDCEICAGVDISPVKYSDFEVYTKLSEIANPPDVVIDFSSPKSLDMMLDYCQDNKVPLVAATTGYSCEQVEKIKTASLELPIFFSANMSLGIALLSELAQKAALVLGDQFDIEIVERHHNQKVDAPSGTALMLADSINKARQDKYHYVYDRHSVRRKREPSEIGIHSVRGGTLPGDHEIIFAGQDEVICISHSAYSKKIFAVGAVNAALFLIGKDPGLYTVSQMLNGD